MYSPNNGTTFSLLGIPIDSADLTSVTRSIDEAAKYRRRLFISTVNANFLAASQRDRSFRGSLLASDLCTADGVGVTILGRLLGLNLPRTSGADLLELLCARENCALGRPLRIFFFGGAPGVADTAHDRINALGSDALLCVGAIDPGFGTVEELSRPEWLRAINDAHPDVLILALGADRGQAWLLHNADRLTVPVRTHFGAAVNFLAGTLRRAPPAIQRCGLEWAWRILMEPKLARRYATDGLALLRLTLSAALPLATLMFIDQLLDRSRQPFSARLTRSPGEILISFSGHQGSDAMPKVQSVFAEALQADAPATLDLAGATGLGLDGLGAIMRLQRDLERRGHRLQLTHMRPPVRGRLRLAASGWLA